MIPQAKDLAVGTVVGISCCPCRFKVVGRDPEPRYANHVLFKRVASSPKHRCDMSNGQVLWLFEDAIAGRPGKHDFILSAPV